MTATVVNGVLLAVILATWMWTWWWNRLVVQRQPVPDYEAATVRLTLELLAYFHDQVPLEAYRARMARNVVNAAFEDRTE